MLDTEDLWGGNKAIKTLLDIGLILNDMGEFLRVKMPVDALYQKIDDRTATRSDKEVIRLLEEQSDKLLRLLQAISFSRPE